VKEIAVTFGERSGLLGVMTEPDGVSSEPLTSESAPSLIVLNSGLLHKAGPSRLGAEMARAAAKCGFRALRFDLSGIGDSRMTTSNMSARERAVHDVRQSMDFVAERYGATQFLLAGLCSGSDNAHYTSLQDSRVVGSIHLDGYCVRNAEYYARHYGGRLLSLRALRDRLRPSQARQLDTRTREYPGLDELTGHFTSLSSRGVRLLYIYTGESDVYNHEGQLRKAFHSVPFGDLLEEEYHPLATHTLTSLVSRSRAIGRMTDWILQHWGSQGRQDKRQACR